MTKCRPRLFSLSTIASLWSLVVLLLVFLPHTLQDADFESVRVRYDMRDRSGRKGDPKGKYWHESVFHPHYDGRFGDHVLSYDEQRGNLTQLMQAYLFSMRDLGAETWLCHGTLLGWWWNRRILPWDTDIDVQMTAHSIGFLAKYYNMTVHDYEGKQYMLEINPGYTNSSYADRLNVIDGRWIDIHTGLFIDITAVRRKPNTGGRIIATKDRHEQHTRDVFPLRQGEFEDMPVNVPNDYMKVLSEEYGRAALTKLAHMGSVTIKLSLPLLANPFYQRHRYDTTSHEWVRVPDTYTKILDCLGSTRHCQAVNAAERQAAEEKARKVVEGRRQKAVGGGKAD